MDKNTETLDALLVKARSEPPVLSREEARAIIGSASTEPTVGEMAGQGLRGRAIAGLGACLAAAVAIGVWLTPTDEPVEKNAARPTMERTEHAATPSTATPLHPPAPEAESRSTGMTPKIVTSQVAPEEGITRDDIPSRSSISRTFDDWRKELPEPKNVPVAGVRFIDLTPTELEALGVRISPDLEILFGCKVGAMTLFDAEKVLTFGTDNPDTAMCQSVDFLGTPGVIVLPSAECPDTIGRKVTPRMVTDSIGARRFMTLQAREHEEWEMPSAIAEKISVGSPWTPQEMGRVYDSLYRVREKSTDLFNIDRLLPVRVFFPAEELAKHPTKKIHRYMILWFDPSRAVLDRLPKHVLIQLFQELDAHIMDRTGAVPATQKAWIADLFHTVGMMLWEKYGYNDDSAPIPTITAGEPTFLGTWMTAGGAIEATSVTPNPASEYVTIHYRLRARTTLRYALYDINGMPMKLEGTVEGHSGNGEITVRLDGIESGLYLVVLTTERGERVVQRLIVKYASET